MEERLTDLAYLAAAVLFILGLRGLTRPKTAVRGNLLGAAGMLLAVVVTLWASGLHLGWIALGIAIGGGMGALAALRVQMTEMPQLVAVFNGLGGAASTLVAGGELYRVGGDVSFDRIIAVALSGMIGAVTTSGSIIAFGKLAGMLGDAAAQFTTRKILGPVMTGVMLGMAGLLLREPADDALYWGMSATAALLGILLVVPIGGADMPVVIALLNAYSGIAAAATGFVLGNNVLIIAGSLVGASGLILTRIMCDAMNRSLMNVMFGAMPAAAAAGSGGDEIYQGRVKSASAEEVAMLFDTARRVVIVPGYGMAVSQAQHAVRDLADLLAEKDIEVEFAIHPVAGRMPGHMNVLLAEAKVPYGALKEMDAVNPTFQQTDVALVIGANDVVNPLARTDPNSPIAGMPILDVDKARTVVVVKRSLSPGFAGIANPLFAADNALMLFGDGQKAMLELITAVKEG